MAAHTEPEPEAEEDLGSWAIAIYEYVVLHAANVVSLCDADGLHFSYEAGEDNEISFKEGDRITHIEAASDDWWQGTDKNGNVGLFPGESPCFWFARVVCAELTLLRSELCGAAGLKERLCRGLEEE